MARAEKKHVCTICDDNPVKLLLRNAVRFTYDLQQLRIATLQRGVEKGGDAPEVHLDDDDKKFIECQSEGLLKLERGAFREIERHASKFKVWEWLEAQKGIGPAGSGVMLSEFDIHIAKRPSQFWSFAGLATMETPAEQATGWDVIELGDERPRQDGEGTYTPEEDRLAWFHDKAFAEQFVAELHGNHLVRPARRAQHPVKGQKLNYNAWLRSKLIVVVGGGLLKAANPTYRPMFDNYRHRKETQLGLCMLCNGTGSASQPKSVNGRVNADAGKKTKCWNCIGGTETQGAPFTPDRAPWGKGRAHRKDASIRYMVKQFVADFWRAWRLAEGLPVVPMYHEAKHGHIHGA